MHPKSIVNNFFYVQYISQKTPADIERENQYFDNSFPGFERTYLEMRNKLTKEEYNDFIPFAKYFCHPFIINSGERLRIVKKIIDINPDERTHACNLLKKVFPKDYLHEFDITKALHNIAKVAPNERDDVVNRAIERFPESPGSSADFLLEISWINLAERDAVMNFLKGLPVSPAGYLETQFIKNLSAIEPSEQKNTIDQVKTLIEEKMGFPVKKEGDWNIKVATIFDKILGESRYESSFMFNFIE